MKTIQILQYGMLTGIFLFACIVIFLVITNIFEVEGEEFKIMEYVAIGLAVLVIIAENVLQKSFTGSLKATDSFREKMNRYRSLKIFQTAILEGGALFSIIVTLLTGNLFILLITGSLFLIILTKTAGETDFFDKIPTTKKDREKIRE